MDQWKPKLELYHQREMTEAETKHTNDARKVQKADREKLRRDRLNEQFVELGNVLDPDRPKHDKASIINDTIQMLKDLRTEVNRLKAKCAALSEEACELTQEKNELREEKSSLISDIENLNAQYQQRAAAGVMYPWRVTDASSVVIPSHYSFPVALPVPSGHIPTQAFPFFTNHYPPGTVPTSGPGYMLYPNYGCSNDEMGDDSSDVATELELNTPGSR